MELPNFIEENKNKIMEIAKWSNKYYRESAIIQYLNNKIKILYSNSPQSIRYPGKFIIKNDLHIHPLPENKIGNNDTETQETTCQYFILNTFRILPSYSDMITSSWNDDRGSYQLSYSKSKYMSNNDEKNKIFNNYIAALDNENNVLYIMNYSPNLIENRMYIEAYRSLAKDIDDFEVQVIREYVDLDDKLYKQFLTNDTKISEYHNYIINEMKNKEEVKKLQKIINDNFILYTIKL